MKASLLLAALPSAALLSGCGEQAVPAPPRPNIIFIYADDLGFFFFIF